eukprot:3249476-Rhodomonas_salina.1
MCAPLDTLCANGQREAGGYILTHLRRQETPPRVAPSADAALAQCRETVYVGAAEGEYIGKFTGGHRLGVRARVLPYTGAHVVEIGQQ